MKPRILMVGPYPPPFGGLGNNMSLLLRSDLSRRFDLDLLRTSKHVKHVKVSQADWWSGPYLAWNSLRMIGRLLRRRPKLVYVKATSDTGFVRDATLMAIARLFGLKVVCHLHGRPMGRLFAETGFWPRQVARAMRLASVTIVLSPGLKTIFGRMFPGQPIVVLPNVVDVSTIAPPPERNGTGPVRLLFVGRLSRDKGAFDLLEVAGRLRETNPGFRIDLVGIAETDAEERWIRERTAALGLAEHLVFHGYRTGAEKSALFAGADIFVLPTYAEIFPNVVLEAMAAGLPVVTTDVPVIPEMVTENVHGHLVKPGDIEGFVVALRGLIIDPARRREIGRHNRREAETRYDVPVAVETLSTIFEQAMA